MRPLVWSDAELAAVRERYDGRRGTAPALARELGREAWQVRHLAARLGLAGKAPRWSADDLAYLLDHWGRLPDAEVARRLGRTAEACGIKATRNKQSRKVAHAGIAMRRVAALLGIDDHKVRKLVDRGWLEAHRTPIRCRAGRVWVVPFEALRSFLRDYPHEYDRARIDDPSGYWSGIAERAWRRDPLLTTAEAARGLRCSHEHVRQLRARGEIEGVKSSLVGGTGRWLYRARSLHAYWLRREGRAS